MLGFNRSTPGLGLRVRRADRVSVSFENGSGPPSSIHWHGIHLHGHHFHELREDGSLGHYRDTTVVDPRQTRDVLCVFDNPRKWLLHCHTTPGDTTIAFVDEEEVTEEPEMLVREPDDD